MRLSARLAAVAEWIPSGIRLTDVGTDHAYLPVWLLLEGQITSAIATDLRPGPLAKGGETVERYGVSDRVELRLCDGLADVSPGETDGVVIAGMGGETILSILAASPWALDKTCVVQPMSSLEDLRMGLEPLGGRILRERLVREGRTLYVIMELARGREHLTPAECWLGKREGREEDPLWPRYAARRRQQAAYALAGLERSRRPEDQSRRQWLEQVCRALNEEELV